MKNKIKYVLLATAFILTMTFGSSAQLDVSNHVQTYMINDKPRILNGVMYMDENYVKLRDFSNLLEGLGADFKVEYDEKNRLINVDTNSRYTPIGGEFLKITKLGTAVMSNVKLVVDGSVLDYTAINVDGFNYFRLRDLTETFKIEVDYNMKSRIVNLTINEENEKPKLTFRTIPDDRKANQETVEIKRNDDGSILVFYSIKVNTGGYTVVTKNVYLDGNTIVIVPEVTGADGMVTQVISYPSTSVEISGDIPQNFDLRVEGQESSISIM